MQIYRQQNLDKEGHLSGTEEAETEASAVIFHFTVWLEDILLQL